MLPLLAPALGITPEVNQIALTIQQHAATRIQRTGLRQRHAEVLKQPLVDAALLKTSHLGGAYIKGVGPAAEGTCTTAALAMSL